jgi:hypothetical protein
VGEPPEVAPHGTNIERCAIPVVHMVVDCTPTILQLVSLQKPFTASMLQLSAANLLCLGQWFATSLCSTGTVQGQELKHIAWPLAAVSVSSTTSLGPHILLCFTNQLERICMATIMCNMSPML